MIGSRRHGGRSTTCGSPPRDLPTLDEIGEPARWIETGRRAADGGRAARRPSRACWSGSPRPPASTTCSCRATWCSRASRVAPTPCACCTRCATCVDSSRSGWRSSTSITGCGRARPSDAAYVRRLAGSPRLPFHLRALTSVPPQGRVGRGVGHAFASRLALAEVARGIVRDRDRRRAHARRSSRDGVMDPAHRVWGLGWHGRHPVPAGPASGRLCSTSRAPRSRRSAARSDLRPRHDPTNDDRRLLRNALRLEAIPALERATGRGSRRDRPNSAACSRDDAESQAHRSGSRRGGASEVERRSPSRRRGSREPARPVASRRHPMRVIAIVRAALGRPGRDAIDAVLDLAAGRPGRRRDLGGLQASARPGVCSVPALPPKASGPIARGGAHRERHERGPPLHSGFHVEAYEPDIEKVLDLLRGDRGDARGDGRADHCATTRASRCCWSGCSRARSS